ncbi:hypothetical protein BU24DRAFT_424547 [Aaosphaeria arxii CBS 175.79]|uniref:Uncharacterized protein n=1 Tax=Aaosphaeria arxii CBS 175.79 TaxID=1450172 RepID=A0A6A5XL25_9PLEO|nr:uncharacterized protein BU24DRAFT_424547 [Aaosphaeria arxii CBS 175.79]KAF2013549.1 hypothetical protein BU24DRAFT_424547 [Aaosphaeria arxii CBS 175.79]
MDSAFSDVIDSYSTQTNLRTSCVRFRDRMCEILITTTKYAMCSTACNSTKRTISYCATAASTGTICPNPTEKVMGQRTSRTQCPLHRDEGYSQT